MKKWTRGEKKAAKKAPAKKPAEASSDPKPEAPAPQAPPKAQPELHPGLVEAARQHDCSLSLGDGGVVEVKGPDGEVKFAIEREQIETSMGKATLSTLCRAENRLFVRKQRAEQEAG